MLIFRFIEFILLFACVFVVLTQVIIPAIRGRVLFPMFRKTADIEKQLDEANQILYDATLSQRVSEVLEQGEKVLDQADKQINTCQPKDDESLPPKA